MASPTLFLFPGEGAHSADTDIALLKCSPSWGAVEEAVKCVVPNVKGLDGFLAERETGSTPHAASQTRLTRLARCSCRVLHEYMTL